MEQLSRPPTPAQEAIVRVYRRLLGLIGGIGLFFVALEVVPPVVAVWLVASLPMAGFGVLCLWTKRALLRPRPATYWATVLGFGGTVCSVVVTSLLHGDLMTPLFTALVWFRPLRGLALPQVRRALSGDDDPSGGLRQRIREARLRLEALLKPPLQPAPVPIAAR